jgi:hypothetical protein
MSSRHPWWTVALDRQRMPLEASLANWVQATVRHRLWQVTRLECCCSQAIPAQMRFLLKLAAPLAMPTHWAAIPLPQQVVMLLGGPMMASTSVTVANSPKL